MADGRGRFLAALALAIAAAATAPPRCAAEALFPLTGETVEPLPHGDVEVHLGVAYFRDRRFPPFTPEGTLRSQDLFQLPRFGFRVGVGDWVEIQASYEFLLLDEELAGGQANEEFGGGDARLFTKVRVVGERGPWPAFGLRFGAKLPNAHRDQRLGTDETDFGVETLFAKDFGPLAAYAGLGMLLLGNGGSTIAGDDRWEPGGQDDLFTWNLALAGAPLADVLGSGQSIRLLAEMSGAAGSHFDNDFTVARVGSQVGDGRLRFFVGASIGIDGAAEDFGVLAGVVLRLRPASWFGDEE